jgi:hypothetical protein
MESATLLSCDRQFVAVLNEHLKDNLLQFWMSIIFCGCCLWPVARQNLRTLCIISFFLPQSKLPPRRGEKVCVRQVSGFLRVLRYTNKTDNWNIVESGVKHYNLNPKLTCWIFSFLDITSCQNLTFNLIF